ncbi:Hypothetical_protein [Hexamita inflata]|uniref:Hypothetical_protein n=1 Tax=Hexamita inflata TaxID=28002 RepID=A0AA86RS00_9EUKA|nr:Hypothetical protein HINF_LOCUS64567 [Hexamita inflata]
MFHLNNSINIQDILYIQLKCNAAMFTWNFKGKRIKQRQFQNKVKQITEWKCNTEQRQYKLFQDQICKYLFVQIKEMQFIYPQPIKSNQTMSYYVYLILYRKVNQIIEYPKIEQLIRELASTTNSIHFNNSQIKSASIIYSYLQASQNRTAARYPRF